MSGGWPFQGTLFAEGFLRDSVTELPDWDAVTDAHLDDLETRLLTLFDSFPTGASANESQTEDDLIWPVLALLGWEASLRQQNLSARGRDDVPDGLLFGNAAAKDRANGFTDEWRRYEFGLVIVESKRWLRPLDRRSGRRSEETAPSAQMLRYLRRVDDLTTGALRWGILTNGRQWRLYYQGALSVSEQFFELDLAAILDIPGYNEDLFALDPLERRHWLTLFVLAFARHSFLLDAADKRTFHQRAIDEGRFHQERVAANLSELVFGHVFPDLARAIADAAPAASLSEVREAALILLYRLLFILYAEDRNLLPVRDSRYDDYALRDKVRGDIGRRKDLDDVFSASAARYWSIVDDLCRAIDTGDASIGLPPYNGGLFDRERTPLLGQVRLNDAVMADAVDALSFERTPDGRRYINYRDLGVQQLGSIYERLLEQEIVRQDDAITVRPNIFARRDSGSYYTPDDLVGLIIKESIDPLIQARVDAFTAETSQPPSDALPEDRHIGRLKRLDPAERILDLKVCDPAMGSGHFLVNLVDHLSDRVIEAMAEAEAAWDGYISPLNERIDNIRNSIIANAEDRGWAVDTGQLDDRHIVRRMVLKRCVYGVDKNPMAVELAKVSLWLHTFTVGAPLSFLDHHLRCGDSLFGAWVRPTIDRAEEHGVVFLRAPLTRAMRAAKPMQIIEGLTDSEIAEAHRSADVFAEVSEMTAPLDAFLSLYFAFDWMRLRHPDDTKAFKFWLSGLYGDPVALALRPLDENARTQPLAERFADLHQAARHLVDTQRFLNWQVAFPGVWSEWEDSGLHGGFDAVIGNPPWDRMKLQQVEWFAARRPDVAMAPRAADRKRLIAELQETHDPLARDYAYASEEAALALRMARTGGDYPLLSGGDVNLYSLFIERAMRLAKPDGLVGLLVPSGVASDKTAARFFKGVATEGRLKSLYDFENRRTRFDTTPFFPDIDSRFKFCAFVASPSPMDAPARCGFFLQDLSEVDNDDRCFPITAGEFARVNPNTGTAPIFRSRRDAELTTSIYDRLPVLVDRSSDEPVNTWPVKYTTMFHMTNDSGLFRTGAELEEDEGAWASGMNRFDSPSGCWLPLYEGKMVQAFDHRAANIVINRANVHRPAQPVPATSEQQSDPTWVPSPQYWVPAARCGRTPRSGWVVGFKEITAPTNARTFIAAVLPAVGFGNKIPILMPETPTRREWLLAANFNAIVFDFATRQKVQGQTVNLFMLEQLPVVPPDRYDAIRYGPQTAAEIARNAVLELTYTAYDMAPFATHLGHLDNAGNLMPPFPWDDERRFRLRAKLDALYFKLYGVEDRDDVRHIYSTFPIVERQERRKYGRYRSRDLCLAWMSALAAGQPDATIAL